MDWALYIHAFTSLFVIIDPIGASLVFHSLVPEDDAKHRMIMAVKTVVISVALIILFGKFGEAFLHELGISIHAFRIAGGILLFHTAFGLITKAFKHNQSPEKIDVSVFPMSIPLLAGPGCLTLSILLFSNVEQEASSVPIVAAILSIYLLTLICLLASKFIKKVIGKTGDDILRRFLGVILAALSIQFVYDGIVQIAA